MSGGHYNYAYSRMNELASDIRDDVERLEKAGVDQWGDEYDALPEDIRLFMSRIADQLEKVAEAAHDIEWYMSCDYGDDTLRNCASFGYFNAEDDEYIDVDYDEDSNV